MKRIGLIAGAGELPVEFAKSAVQKDKDIIIYGIKGITDKKIQNTAPTKWFYLGQAQKLIDTMKQDNVSDVVMLGKIEHYHLLTSIHRFDKRAREFFGKLIDKRAKSILEGVLKELEEEGFNPIDPSPYLSNLLAPEGVISGKEPSKELLEDAHFGLKIAKEIAQLDIGQTVVVKDKIVIAVEGLEGTDKCIIRGGELGGEGTVVCKVARRNQDMRYDVPVIGEKTLKNMKKVKSKLLAVESGKTFILNIKKLKELSHKFNVSIVGIRI